MRKLRGWQNLPFCFKENERIKPIKQSNKSVDVCVKWSKTQWEASLIPFFPGWCLGPPVKREKDQKGRSLRHGCCGIHAPVCITLAYLCCLTGEIDIDIQCVWTRLVINNHTADTELPPRMSCNKQRTSASRRRPEVGTLYAPDW